MDNPATFCFLASVRECPVKLLDASDGRVSPLLYIYILCWMVQEAGTRTNFRSSERHIRLWIIESDRSLLTAYHSTPTLQSNPVEGGGFSLHFDS